jgi:hypothetical protein
MPQQRRLVEDVPKEVIGTFRKTVTSINSSQGEAQSAGSALFNMTQAHGVRVEDFIDKAYFYAGEGPPEEFKNLRDEVDTLRKKNEALDQVIEAFRARVKAAEQQARWARATAPQASAEVVDCLWAWRSFAAFLFGLILAYIYGHFILHWRHLGGKQVGILFACLMGPDAIVLLWQWVDGFLRTHPRVSRFLFDGGCSIKSIFSSLREKIFEKEDLIDV